MKRDDHWGGTLAPPGLLAPVLAAATRPTSRKPGSFNRDQVPASFQGNPTSGD
jgi:hypothetical protein